MEKSNPIHTLITKQLCFAWISGIWTQDSAVAVHLRCVYATPLCRLAFLFHSERPDIWLQHHHVSALGRVLCTQHLRLDPRLLPLLGTVGSHQAWGSGSPESKYRAVFYVFSHNWLTYLLFKGFHKDLPANSVSRQSPNFSPCFPAFKAASSNSPSSCYSLPTSSPTWGFQSKISFNCFCLFLLSMSNPILFLSLHLLLFISSLPALSHTHTY